MLPDPLLTPKADAYIRQVYGSAGAAWLASLAGYVARLAERWSLTDLRVQPGAGRSAVLTGTRCAAPVVLKVEPDRTTAAAATVALARWAALGAAPEVLESDADGGAYLLAWVSAPPLSAAADGGAAATAALADVLRRAGEPPAGMPWRPGFLAQRLEQARRRAVELAHPTLTTAHVQALAPVAAGLAAADPFPALLHADLTPRNVHAAAGRVCLLDPDPASGPLSFDLSYWSFRVGLGERFAELTRVAAAASGVDVDLLTAWGPVHATTFALYQLTFSRAVPAATLRLAHRH